MKKVLFLVCFLVSCSNDESEIKTIRVGSNDWMLENVNGYHSWQSAIKACPNGFRLPSRYDYQELIDYNSYIINQKGGYIINGIKYEDNKWGYYWTSSIISNSGSWSYIFSISERMITGNNNDLEMCVRCVKD